MKFNIFQSIRFYCLAITTCFVLINISAQAQNRFQHLDKTNGLADNHVNSLAQDSLGYIWAQNPGVLSRYDGYNFKIFKHDPYDSSRSALNFVLGVLYTDGAGSVPCAICLVHG